MELRWGIGGSDVDIYNAEYSIDYMNYVNVKEDYLVNDFDMLEDIAISLALKVVSEDSFSSYEGKFNLYMCIEGNNPFLHKFNINWLPTRESHTSAIRHIEGEILDFLIKIIK